MLNYNYLYPGFWAIDRSQHNTRVRVCNILKFLIHYVKIHIQTYTMIATHVYRDLSGIENPCNLSTNWLRHFSNPVIR